MLYPKALKKGDTIGLIAPSSPPKENLIPEAVQAIEQLGFQVIVGSSCFQKEGNYLAGTAVDRAAELMHMFQDDAIDAILCVRGGYGSPQLLPLLDYETIRNHPKIFIGYSDITALHVAFHQKCDLVTFHGPMGTSDFVDKDPFTTAHFLSTVTSDSVLTIKNPPCKKMFALQSGSSKGQIIGGNLTLICALLGTPYEIDTKNRLLFIEEIGEEPYKVDRMLTQLALSGKLADASGFLLGSWTGCDAPVGFDVLEVCRRILGPYKKPILANIRAGHCSPQVTLPFGVEAVMDATSLTLQLQHSPTIS